MTIIPEPSMDIEVLAAKYRPLIKKIIGNVLFTNRNNHSIEYDDLYSIALMALMDAIETYDISREIYFFHYMRTIIKNRLVTYCRDFLPHRYVLDEEKTGLKGKSVFKRVPINVCSYEVYTEVEPSMSYEWTKSRADNIY